MENNKDYSKMSDDELIHLYKEYKFKSIEKDKFQQSYKWVLNSLGFGVFGTPGTAWYSLNIANSITSAGRISNKTMFETIIKYFTQTFEKDNYLHKVLKKEFPDYYLDNPKNTVINEPSEMIVMGDTDSLVVSFSDFIKNNFKPDLDLDVKKSIILCVFKNRLENIFKKRLNLLAEEYNCPMNKHSFEMENIYESILNIGKKHYISNIIFQMPDINIKSGEKFKWKGVQVVRSSTPDFVRKYLKREIEYLILNNKELNKNDIVKRLLDIYSLYRKSEISELSFKSSVNTFNRVVNRITKEDGIIYNKVTNSKGILKEITVPAQVSASANYNYLLLKNPKLNTKYERIKEGDKISWYNYVKRGNETKFNTKISKNEIFHFGYPANSFPRELKPPQIYYEGMFIQSFLEPYNTFLEVIKGFTISENLFKHTGIFSLIR